jgi:heme/copper-type cytochrome/quinol oxidase subunit 4
MNYKDILIGFFLGILAAFLGILLFLSLFTDYNLFRNFYSLRVLGLMGKIITLGAILNLILFLFLMKKDKELMARGVLIATILLGIITIFI